MIMVSFEFSYERCSRKGKQCSYCGKDISRGDIQEVIRLSGYRDSANYYYCDGHLIKYLQEKKINTFLGEDENGEHIQRNDD